jgi:hypothetical protein
MFHYLGSLINYSLQDDDNITAQIASATAVMGALTEIWQNPHLDIYNNYLLFRAIPINLLLGEQKHGCCAKCNSTNSRSSLIAAFAKSFRYR